MDNSKGLSTETWAAIWAAGTTVVGAIIAWLSARALKREDTIAANLRTQLDGWKSLATEYQGQISYRDRQIAQYIVLIETLRNERSAERFRIDELERERVTLYHELNELRRNLGMSMLPVPVVQTIEPALPPTTQSSTC